MLLYKKTKILSFEIPMFGNFRFDHFQLFKNHRQINFNQIHTTLAIIIYVDFFRLNQTVKKCHCPVSVKCSSSFFYMELEYQLIMSIPMLPILTNRMIGYFFLCFSSLLNTIVSSISKVIYLNSVAKLRCCLYSFIVF